MKEITLLLEVMLIVQNNLNSFLQQQTNHMHYGLGGKMCLALDVFLRCSNSTLDLNQVNLQEHYETNNSKHFQKQDQLQEIYHNN